jgi:serine/threonine protein phosphatase 1
MGRAIVVGDIHGRFAELTELLNRFSLRDDDLLVSVGDLVDRGPDPGSVVRLFQERPNSIAVMGNHERKHVRGIHSYAEEITRPQPGGSYPSAVAWMSALPYHLWWLLKAERRPRTSVRCRPLRSSRRSSWR